MPSPPFRNASASSGGDVTSPPAPSIHAQQGFAHPDNATSGAALIDAEFAAPPAAPTLITFQRLGFEPEYAAYSARGVAADHVFIYHERDTPAGVVALILLITCAPLLLLCARAARAVLAEEHGALLSRRGSMGDGSPEFGAPDAEDDSPSGSPSPSRAVSPELPARTSLDPVTTTELL